MKPDKVGSTTDIILSILNEEKLLEGAPYIERISGILRTTEIDDSQICKQLIDEVMNLSENFLSQIKKVSSVEKKINAHWLEENLKTYFQFLKGVHDGILSHQTRTMLAKLLPWRSDPLKKLSFTDKVLYTESVFQADLEAQKEAQDLPGQASDLQLLRMLYYLDGFQDIAEEALRDALELHTATQGLSGQATDMWVLGEIYTWEKRLEEAVMILQEALILHKELQDVHGQGYDLKGLGKVYELTGQLEKAEKTIQDVLDLHRQARVFVVKAVVTVLQAWERFIYAEVGDILHQGNVIRIMRDIFQHRGQLEKAEERYRDALNHYEEAQSTVSAADDLNRLGHMYWQDRCFNSTQDFQIPYTATHALSLMIMGNLYMGKGQPAKAEATLQNALDINKRCNSINGQGNALMLQETFHLSNHTNPQYYLTDMMFADVRV
ncbi:hypothetical protein M422DRAFT_240942 [Sphaerobolus stellatus SS14]|nr:hypothetical protein M422DRAFT_240942 [Sphaerobolus stellatus SS14]